MVGDDCCKGAAYTREVRDAYETLRRFDPFHVAAGAFECGEMHSFQEPLLAVDLPMRENYRPDLPSHAGDAVGGEFAFAGGDGALRLAPMRWEPVVNMPQPCRQATGRAVVAEAFVGLVTGDLFHLNWYVFNRQQGFERWPLLPYVDEANALVNELLPHLMRGERREIRVAAEDLLEPSRPAVVRAAAYALDGCVRVVAVNAGDAPARATLAAEGAAGAATRLFDANVSRPVVNGAFSDVLDGLGTELFTSLPALEPPSYPGRNAPRPLPPRITHRHFFFFAPAAGRARRGGRHTSYAHRRAPRAPGSPQGMSAGAPPEPTRLKPLLPPQQRKPMMPIAGASLRSTASGKDTSSMTISGSG